jgi:hypothetical protein
MALTKQQEAFLAELADKGIAEAADAAARNAVIEAEVAIQPLVDAEAARLRALKDTEYAAELQAYKDSLKP